MKKSALWGIMGFISLISVSIMYFAGIYHYGGLAQALMAPGITLLLGLGWWLVFGIADWIGAKIN